MARHLPRTVRPHAAAPRRQVGLAANFTILDTDDQLRLLKQVMEAERIDAKRWVPPALMAIIQRWKDRGLTPARVTPPRTPTSPKAGRASCMRRIRRGCATLKQRISATCCCT